MTPARRTRLLAQLADGSADLGIRHLCDVATEVLDVSGTGLMLMAHDVARGSLCTTDYISATIEELQFALGEGPCVDAYRDDRPALEPDLEHPDHARWPAFVEPAIEVGARAVFCFPLRVGSVKLGALDLYRAAIGPLSFDQHADALALADIAARAVLVLQAEAPSGQVAVELEAGADFQFVVHQASGMVAAQLDIDVDQALDRLRAHAFAASRPLTVVADDLVARRLHFDPTTGEAA